jgi:hypothetical protein
MRTFTLDEAHTMLPVLESLLRNAIAEKKKLEQFEQERQALSARVLLSGGLLVDVAAVRARKQAEERGLQRAKDAVEEIQALGVQVKDLDMGLLDFPCAVDDEIILLCWKLGEPRIAHWHGMEEGYKGRKPIDDRIARARPKPPS